MIRQTNAAARQISDLLDHFIALDRDEAAQRLLDAVDAACGRIDAAPNGGASHPGPYPQLERWNYRWIKVHRYWFAYRFPPPPPVLTNVIWEGANLPRRIKTADDGPKF